MSGIHRSQLAGSVRDILPHSRLHERRSVEPQTTQAGLSAEARAQPSGKGARSQIAGPVPWVRREGTNCRFGQVEPEVTLLCSVIRVQCPGACRQQSPDDMAD
jgi:hypothetical protein